MSHLTPGARLGPYQIVSSLGAGGMGEVFKAKDTRLDRTVAIKVLPAHLASDPEAKARFEREAKAVAALNHPHICTLHDVGRVEGSDFLVMELVEGETLAKRLERGALPLDLSLKVAVQVADALDKAHRAGIIHRDLKPSNIMLTKSGAKLLDFGLAKHTTQPAVSGFSMAPTQAPITGAGMVLGSLNYMSPEQVEGKDVDHRSDIFSFGCVLYEMVTGKKAFRGASAASLMAAILEREPARARESEPSLPAIVDEVVSRALQKSPEDRWQSSGDIRHLLALTIPTTHRTNPRTLKIAIAASAFLGIAGLVAAAVSWSMQTQNATATIAFDITPPAGHTFLVSAAASRGATLDLAVSRDGRRIAFVATTPQNRPMLWVRDVAAVAPTPLPGTEGAYAPFWSPDGASIAFFRGSKLMRLDIRTGALQLICDAPNGRGGDWHPDGTIIFAGSLAGPLSRVAAVGGQPKALTSLDPARGEVAHRWPRFIDDEGRFIYFVRSGPREHRGIYLSSLAGDAPTMLTPTNSSAEYYHPYVVYIRDDNAVAHRLDARAGRLVGDPRVVVRGVGASGGSQRSGLSIGGGTLAYVPDRVATSPSRLAWFSRDGRRLGLMAEAGNYGQPTISPDGRMVAVDRSDGDQNDVWVFDIASNSPRRLTFDGSSFPVWGRDSASLLTTRNSPLEIHLQRLEQGAAGSVVPGLNIGSFPTDFAPTGEVLFQTPASTTGWDVWIAERGQPPRPLIQTSANEAQATLSPDGEWLAYTSDQSGQDEVYLRRFPTGGAVWQVSAGGGTMPQWRADSRELFFMSPERAVWTVSVPDTVPVAFPPALKLFSAPMVIGTRLLGRVFAPSPDGERFLVLTADERSSDPPVSVILNWQTALPR